MKWIIIEDKEHEIYKIFTEEEVIESDDEDGNEQQWIASVYELEDAIEIIDSHNKQQI